MASSRSRAAIKLLASIFVSQVRHAPRAARVFALEHVMKKNFNRARARWLLATTMLAGLASSPMVPGAAALAQTADQPVPTSSGETAPISGGTTPLPPVDVNGAEGSGTGCGLYGGAPCSGYGGAGLAQDPFNPSYVLPDASTGTKTDTPIMDTPLNVQVIPQQVLRDQQVVTLDQALQNVSGVSVSQRRDQQWQPIRRHRPARLSGHAISTATGSGWTAEATPYPPPPPPSNWPMSRSIEVLKGPAAILYGLSEPGGIINLVTKEPLNAPYYSVQQQIGSLRQFPHHGRRHRPAHHGQARGSTGWTCPIRTMARPSAAPLI